jgi:hypothetical protein
MNACQLVGTRAGRKRTLCMPGCLEWQIHHMTASVQDLGRSYRLLLLLLLLQAVLSDRRLATPTPKPGCGPHVWDDLRCTSRLAAACPPNVPGSFSHRPKQGLLDAGCSVPYDLQVLPSLDERQPPPVHKVFVVDMPHWHGRCLQGMCRICAVFVPRTG